MSRRHVARSVETHPDAPDGVLIGDGLRTVDEQPDRAALAAADPLTCLTRALDSSSPGSIGQRGPARWVAALLAGAVEAVPGVDMGSVAETTTRGATTWSATLPVAEELDRRGAEWGEGPGAEALRERVPVGTVTIRRLNGPLAPRWPRWSTRARAAGVAATLSVVLPGAPRKRPAVLALHGGDASVFGPAAIATARAFAAPLALAVQAASRVEGLQQALETRDVIGRAKGLLMARWGIDDRAAFERLVSVSQNGNVRLAEVASLIVEVGPDRVGDDLAGDVRGSLPDGGGVG